MTNGKSNRNQRVILNFGLFSKKQKKKAILKRKNACEKKPHKLRNILLVLFLIEMQLPDKKKKTEKNRIFQWKNKTKKKGENQARSL